ncbi:MAG: hypothetical protein KDK97_22565, partial [Verrucomicrobiales bacterium]|nr:hypothetical protein [Verrucomicrobiales bacterium]
MSDDESEVPPYKVGDVIEERGGRRQVTAVWPTKDGAWMYQTSAEPLAVEKGYLTMNQVLGYQIQHYPPPSPPSGGAPRNPARLTADDWDFTEIMKEPLEVRKVALVHELARESAAVREACRIYNKGLAEAKEWETKEATARREELDAEEEVERREREFRAMCAQSEVMENADMQSARAGLLATLKIWEAKQALNTARERARLASCNVSFIAVNSGNGKERQSWKAANEFLQLILNRLPFGARCFDTDWIADDVPWCRAPSAKKFELVEKMKEIERKRGKECERLSLSYADMAADGPGWPYDDPIQFAREWDEDTGRPEFSFNDGRPGRMILAERHDDAPGLPILSEALDMCVCLNFSDDEIIASFADWLKWRRAHLHDDLTEFRAAGGSALRMQKGRVNAGFKALAALRLRAKFSGKEAAIEFREVYPAAEKRKRKKSGDIAPMAQVANLAKGAVELAAEFLPGCQLDSAAVSH